MGQFNILVLPGDGIGPEVTGAARRVLDTVGSKYGHTFSFSEDIVGGIAIDRYGHPLRVETVQAAKRSDAVLFGAVGGPKWDNAPIRPEAAILGLRKALGLFANLRPITVLPGMEGSSPLKDERVKGTDIIIIRELTGGLYFAKPKRRWTTSQGRRGVDTLRYTEREVERVVRVAFELAQGRRKKVTSVDKANVLESSKLWREVATEVGMDYPEVELEHALVDSCAMQLIANPTRFDVMVMENMFGDILSDLGGGLLGSLGLMPSACVGPEKAYYEPAHGSAPDIAGQGIANPYSMIGSVAMMLETSFGLTEEAQAVWAALEQVFADGYATADLAATADGVKALSTAEFGDAVVKRLVAT